MPIKNRNQSLKPSTDKLQSKQSKTMQQSTKQSTSSVDKFTQDFIDIADISDGFVFLKNGTIVKILEFLPINYSEKPDADKDAIADSFGYIFKQFPRQGHLKIFDSKANLDTFKHKLSEVIKKETDPYFLERMEDYFENTENLQKQNTNKKRFFYIFSYEGKDGKKSDKLNDILNDMWNQTMIVAQAFRSLGNVCLNADMDNNYEAEILYTFFNPRSFDTEGFSKRIQSVSNAREYLEQKGESKLPPTVDYIAPRGLKFNKWDNMIMDGVYHTFLMLKDNSFPTSCTVGWLDHIFVADPNCDIDIHIKQQVRETAEAIIDRFSVIRRGLVINRGANDDKAQELLSAANNSDYILSCLRDNDEDLYDVSIMVTLRANSWKELQNKKDNFLKHMKSKSFYFEECFMQTQEFFKMAMPLNTIVHSIFNANKRNMTNSSLSSLYCLTSFEMYDPTGFCMGTMDRNSSLFAINNFNAAIFANPHIFIAGTTGAGKSYTEMMLGSRMRLTGMSTVFLLPLKGYEYADMIHSLGGSFISLHPGGNACVNIMEIRPEGVANFTDLEDIDIKMELSRQSPLLAKKITSILTWLTLLSGTVLPYDVEADLNVALTNIYNRFGITDDNMSIWEDFNQKKLKTMPIIGDLYNEIKDTPKLKKIAALLNTWVDGNCKNMNGQTNVDLTNKCIAFDINEDMVGARFLPAFMYIGFDVAYDIAKADLSQPVAIFLDEIWKLLTISSCGEQIYKMIKIVRAYNACVVSATQDIKDCSDNKYGRSILTLSAIKIFLKANQEEVQMLASSVSFSDYNKMEIQNLRRGQGFVCYNTERIKVNFISSILEMQLYDPDPKHKVEAKSQRAAILQGKKTLF